MDSTGENTAEDNPQISYRTELGTHNSTKDGACTRNVQKLNHENLPTGKDNKVNAIGLCHCRGHTVIWPENNPAQGLSRVTRLNCRECPDWTVACAPTGLSRVPRPGLHAPA